MEYSSSGLSSISYKESITYRSPEAIEGHGSRGNVEALKKIIRRSESGLKT